MRVSVLIALMASLIVVSATEQGSCNKGEYSYNLEYDEGVLVKQGCAKDVLRPYVCGSRRNLEAGIWDHFHVSAHDSGASRFESLSVHEETPEHNFNFGILNMLLLGLPQYIVEQVSRAQSKSLGQLVQSGVTYIDLRVAWSSTHQDWWVLHGYFCYSINEALISLENGISKTEWPVIKTEEQVVYLKAKFKSVLGKYSVETSKRWPKLGQVWGKQNRVFLVNDEMYQLSPREWRLLSSGGFWPDKTDHLQSYNACVEFTRRQINSTKIVGVQFLVTPTAKSTIWNMITFRGWSLKHYASQMFSLFPEFKLTEGIGKVSIISVDEAHNLAKYLMDDSKY
ncbi:hypothetical protein AKO1_010056 [Acrasis kona]|uniref:Uncharacterized protein n=1 Tax=Acrasis kona TaxID=1008807 RepID=A0AAW2ZR20_9EUKA